VYQGSRNTRPNRLSALRERLNHNSLLRRFSGGVYWTLIGNISWRTLSAISSILIARILGPQQFGIFGMLQSTMRMFSVYAGFRLGATATKHVAEFRTSDPGKAARILKIVLTGALALGLAASLTMIVAAPWLAKGFLDRPELTLALCLCAGQMFFSVYGTIKECALAGFEDFRAIARVNILSGLLTPLFCIPATWFWGVPGAVMGLTIVAVVGLFGNGYYLNRNLRKAGFPEAVSIVEACKESNVLWQFTLPGFLIGMLLTVLTWVGRLFFIDMADGYAELGLFEAANQWRTFILFLPAVLARVFLPIVAESYGRAADSEVRSALSLQFQTICMITLPLAVATIGLSEPLAALYGREFIGLEQILPLLISSVFLFAINQPLKQLLNGTGHVWINLNLHIIWSGAYLFGCFILIPEFGAVGFAGAHLLAEFVHFGVQFLYIDFLLFRAFLRPQLLLLTFCLLLLAGVYAAQISATSGASMIVTGLFFASIVPAAAKLRRTV